MQKEILRIFYFHIISLIFTAFKLCCPAHLFPNTPRTYHVFIWPTSALLQLYVKTFSDTSRSIKELLDGLHHVPNNYKDTKP